jgi:hypothetical protein
LAGPDLPAREEDPSCRGYALILQGAMGALSAVRALEDRLRDADYVSMGKRANMEELTLPGTDLFEELNSEESLSDVLEVPFALKHVTDIRGALSDAVAQVGDTHGDCTRQTKFHATFAAFALGFGIGVVVSHRAKALKIAVDRLSGRTVSRCEDWGALVALYYLVLVDTRGIIDKKTDHAVYGIGDRWRVLLRDRSIEPVPEIQASVDMGRRAGERWQSDRVVDVGAELAIALMQAMPRTTTSIHRRN